MTAQYFYTWIEIKPFLQWCLNCFSGYMFKVVHILVNIHQYLLRLRGIIVKY